MCVFTSNGTCVWTTNGGTSWSESQTGLTTVRNVNFVDANYGFANGDALVRTTDGGKTWASIHPSGFNRVVFWDKERGLSIDNLSVTSDSGRTWITKYTRKADSYDWEYFVRGIMLDSAWIVFSEYGSHGGLIGSFSYLSTDYGQSWTKTRLSTGIDVNTLEPFSRNKIVGFDYKSVKISADSGLTWVTSAQLPDDFNDGRENPLFYSRRKIIPLNEFNWWMCGGYGSVYRTTDAGLTWFKVLDTPLNTILCLAFNDPFTGWVGGLRGFILKTTDAGNTWRKIQIPLDIPTGIVYGTPVRMVYMFDSLRAVFVTNDRSRVFRTLDGGSSMTEIPNPQRYQPYFLNDSTGWVVNWDTRTLYRTTNAGATWDSLYSNRLRRLYRVHFLTTMTGFVGVDSATIARTEDGGITWNTQTISTNSNVTPGNFRFVNDTVGFVSYLTRYDGGLEYWSTTDRGISWRQQSPPPPNAIELFPVDEKRLWVITAGPDRRALLSVDAGATWFDTNSGPVFTLFSLPSGETWAGGDSARILFFDMNAVGIKSPGNSPDGISLQQNYPNAFGPGSESGSRSTIISFTTDETSATIRVFDILGRERISIPIQKTLTGHGALRFEPELLGIRLPSGMCLYRLETDKQSVTRRMIWLQ